MPPREEGWNYRIRGARKGFDLAFARDGKTLHAVGSNGAVGVWDVATKKEVRRLFLKQEKNEISTPPAFLPGLAAVLTANSSEWGGESPEALHLWDLASGRATEIVSLREGADKFEHVICSAVVCSRDSRWLASSQKLATHSIRTQYMDPSLRLFDGLTNRESLRIKGVLSQTMDFSRDGRILAADTGSAETWGNIGVYGYGRSVGLWDTLTGEQFATLSGHLSTVNAVAFSPDRKTLASASADHSVLIWQLPPPKQAPADESLTDAQLHAWWDELADPDVRKIRQAAANLVRNPVRAVGLLRGKLFPATQPDETKVADLIRNLESADFKLRNDSHRKLSEMGDAAEPALKKAIDPKANDERQRRISQLLARLDSSTSQLRIYRSVTVLEQIGTPDAIAVISALAAGMPEARSTRDAREAMDRLTR